MRVFMSHSDSSAAPSRRPWFPALVGPVGLALLFVIPLFAQSNQEKPEDNKISASARTSLVRVVKTLYDVSEPYSAPEVREVFGSAAQLGSNVYLTDLELVRHATVVQVWSPEQVREPGAPEREIPADASVLHAGRDCGLAIIVTGETLDRDAVNAVLKGAVETFPGGAGIPVGSEISVHGFDRPGEAPSVRRVPVSALRPELIAGSDIDERSMALIQERPGGPGLLYRGGPVAVGERWLGIYHAPSDLTQARDNRAYVLDVSVVRRFLLDASDGRYEGFGHTGVYVQPVQRAAARKYLGLPLDGEEKDVGVLVRRVDYRSPAWDRLRPGDVLLYVENEPVHSLSARIVLKERSLEIDEYIRERNVETTLRLLRNGRVLRTKVTASVYPGRDVQRARAVPERAYFLGGGLVFQELDYDLIHNTEAGRVQMLRHRYFDFLKERYNEQVDRDVVLTARLPDAVNAGTEQFIHGVVHSVNGRRIRDLKSFAAEWSYVRDDYVVIRFIDRGDPLVLNFDEARQSEERIVRKYQIQENGRVR